MNILTQKGEMIMKKWLAMLLTLVLLAGSASAAIQEPDKPTLDYKEYLGLQAKRGVVLCRSLSVHAEPNGRSRKITTLTAGDSFITWESENGWYNCYYDENKEVAWVRSAYVVLDPMYYVTDSETAVYAYGDRNAPRVGLLDDGERLPILLETDHYCVVSLRGASGWIRKTANDTIHQSWFDPEMLSELVSAELTWNGLTLAMEDEQRLEKLSELLTDVQYLGKQEAECSFGSNTLKLTFAGGRYIMLELAEDDCAVYRVDGRDYRYGYSQDGQNEMLLGMFPGYMGIVQPDGAVFLQPIQPLTP